MLPPPGRSGAIQNATGGGGFLPESPSRGLGVFTEPLFVSLARFFAGERSTEYR